jgi:hypothetical protein
LKQQQQQLTLHFGASAPASALMALSALDSSTKEMTGLSSSSATICSSSNNGQQQSGQEALCT